MAGWGGDGSALRHSRLPQDPDISFFFFLNLGNFYRNKFQFSSYQHLKGHFKSMFFLKPPKCPILRAQGLPKHTNLLTVSQQVQEAQFSAGPTSI